MSWQPIDFQGIIDLDHQIIDQLDAYLQDKETRLAHKILNLIPLSPDNDFSPFLPLDGVQLKLADAVEGFNKKVRAFNKTVDSHLPVDQGKGVITDLNRSLSEFIEVLEGCVVELFQQVQQIPLDRWHISVSQVVSAIKDILVHRIEDLIWTIRRLEKPLTDYYFKCQNKERYWKPWQFLWTKTIDRRFLQRLNQSETYLKTYYNVFYQRYQNYMHLSLKVEDYLQQMKNYPVLALLDVSYQNLYIDVFRLLKILELNYNFKDNLVEETIRSLKRLTSVDHILKVFRLYLREIKEAFFNSSIEWKSLKKEENYFQEAFERLNVKIQDYQQELQQLTHTISRYREFLLKTDANPYIRSRWGFTEWIVGPEPIKAKKLLYLTYSAEELNTHFNQFKQSLAMDSVIKQKQEQGARQEIEDILEAMGQPLISQNIMRRRFQQLLDQIKIYDEVGNSNLHSINYIGDVLSQAMREDWKYHILHEFSAFHEVYRLHLGLAEFFDDPSHAFRLERFRLLFDQIEEWVKKGRVYSHVHEIELDINDMKAYLQDFLASIQRVAKSYTQDPFLNEKVHKLRQQLMEYRYLFGQFFHSVTKKDREGQQLRHEFLFVDQYFESAEKLLLEMHQH
jgi:uncharacterized damage-inducible protein DinB